MFGRILTLARQVREQRRHQRGPNVYSMHVPEVECIDKGKTHRLYETGLRSRSPPRWRTSKVKILPPM